MTVLAENSTDTRWGKEVLRAVIHALVASIFAIPACLWTARGVLADMDRRVTLTERAEAEDRQMIEQLRASVVPRSEMEAHWRAAEEAARETREDIRELRRILERPRSAAGEPSVN